MEAEDGLTVQYMDVNRARSEQFVYEGQADIFLSSLAWLKHPDKVLSTEPLSQNVTYLYSLTPFDASFSLASLYRQRICTRNAYVYPTLHEYFNNGVTRVDSSSQATMLSMMRGGRCDYSVINQYNAMSLFNTKEFCGVTFFRSPSSVNEVPNSFILRKNKTALAEKINLRLKQFKQSGQFKQSLTRHIEHMTGNCQQNKYLPP